MIVGVLELEFHLPYSSSLKEKRQIIQSIITLLRNKFRMSVSEIGYQDLWQRSLIGAAYVGSEGGHVREVLNKAEHWCETAHSEAEIIARHTHLFYTDEE